MLLDNIEDDELANELEDKINLGLSIARKNGMTFAKFKSEIITTYNVVYDGEEAEEDYEEYCLSLSEGVYKTPTEWGKFLVW